MSVRSWSLSAGTDGYFLLPESASIGDVESRACVAICPVTALRQRIVRIKQVVRHAAARPHVCRLRSKPSFGWLLPSLSTQMP